MEQQCLEEGDWIPVLTLGRDDEGEICAESLSAERGTIAEAYFAEDYRESETLLGVVVGGVHAVDVEEGEDTVCVAGRINESLPEIFGIWVIQAGATDGIEPALKFGFPGIFRIEGADYK